MNSTASVAARSPDAQGPRRRNTIFFEDDSLFAKKKRAYTLLRLVAEMKLKLLNVNGINISPPSEGLTGSLASMVSSWRAVEAGFSTLTLPFESANQRLIDKYTSIEVERGRDGHEGADSGRVRASVIKTAATA